MAGIKITDLLALASAATDDYLCIVDVSDTTSSPEGTTKKIEVGNLFESGAFAPVLSAATGAISATSGPDGMYSRVGNVVNFTFTCNVSFDFSGSFTGSFQFTIPISYGSGFSYGTVTLDFDGNINGTIINNVVSLITDDNTLIGVAVPIICTTQYLIV
jgi:hypothetical protein